MTPTWQSDDGRIVLYCADCRDVLPVECDCVISDPPFSARTHAGHDSAARGHKGQGHDGAERVALGYAPWTGVEVQSVCERLPAKGWCCVLADHCLAREWERCLAGVGRYVFAPVPCVVHGRSVRLSGDGPCSWTDWLVCSRTVSESRWGTLTGEYRGSAGQIEHKGGKPRDMMLCIVRDYSRSRDVVTDFCMGGGTTGVACIRAGRKFIGIEKDARYFEIARARLKNELRQGMLDLTTAKGGDDGTAWNTAEDDHPRCDVAGGCGQGRGDDGRRADRRARTVHRPEGEEDQGGRGRP